MASLVKLQPGQLVVGDRSPFNVYTRARVLLLSRGSPVESEQQVESLLMQGYVDPAEKVVIRDGDTSEVQRTRYTRELNPFLEVENCYQQLQQIYLDLAESRKPRALPRTISDMAEQLVLLARKMPHALLGAAHWPQTHATSSVAHTLRCAVLIAVVAQKLKLEPELLHSTLCAALTANLSMLELQEILNQQQEALSSIQISRIKGHPEKSAFLLESLGVGDEIWLQAVLQHHERLDGSGYPKQLKGSAIGTAARLIGLADSYTAMTAYREYRALLTPKQAMRQMLGEENELLDPELGKVFLSQLGMYPPGTVVALANGDIAVVVERGAAINEPMCAAIRAGSGQLYMQPPRRDTSDPRVAIQKILDQELLKKLQPFLFWRIKASKAINA